MLSRYYCLLLSPRTPHTRSLPYHEGSAPRPLNWTDHGGTFGGEMQNGGYLRAESIANHNQKQNDELHRLGLRVKHHEDNVTFLKSQIHNLDESIFDKQVSLSKYHSSHAAMKNENINNLQTEEHTIEQILQQEKAAAGVLCQLQSKHGSMASKLPFTKDVIGIVATLGNVDNDNLSRLFAEYLGLETMTAIVCKTYDGVKALEAYDEGGSIKKDIGLHGLGPSIGRQMDGRFLAICLEDLRAYGGEFIENDTQRRLALVQPRFPNGESPSGFLGFAVNMLNIENVNLSCLTASGHGLRETLFYSLFSSLQVYRTRKEMLLALPCIKDGAISLDGGMIRTSGVFALGNKKVVEVRFPVSTETANLPLNYLEAEQQIKLMKWEKERIFEDIQREEALLNHAKQTFGYKKGEYLKFATESAAYFDQHPSNHLYVGLQNFSF
ncbi:hypothetical protein ACHQM5_022480 [Ranunculus cassubicifolius]